MGARNGYVVQGHAKKKGTTTQEIRGGALGSRIETKTGWKRERKDEYFSYLVKHNYHLTQSRGEES